MKLFNKFAIAAVGVVLGFGAIQGQAQAASLGQNMVENGEFEEFTNSDRQHWRKSSVQGWETSNQNGELEIWYQGFEPGGKGPNTIGTDGKEAGSNLEFNVDDGITKIWQTFQLTEDFGTNAVFSFDAWSRNKGKGTVSVFGKESGMLLEEAAILMDNISEGGNSWTQNLYKFGVIAGDEITIEFQSNETGSSKSPHIDQVYFGAAHKKSFAQTQAVPEPASILGLLAVGAFGGASTLKRKKKQEA